MRFGKSLDYRDERLVGDIKYLWEPARHAELVTLAQAWRLTGDVRYSGGCRTLLDSWFEQCPYPLGPHWTSSLEHGVRLLNWSFAWHLLGGDKSELFESGDGRHFRERWLASIYQHCNFVAANLSRYSSANNHLLGELAGLYVGSLTWPYWEVCAHWRATARREFEQQALLQNGPDGVNREQATWYHHEVIDMMLVVGLLARASGCDFTPDYWRRLEAMLEFTASIMDLSGNVPAFGDADDAVISRLDPDNEADVHRSLLATGAVLFARPEFKLKAGGFDDKSRWLLGDEAAERFAALQAPIATQLPIRRAFADAGYYILGNGFETPRELRLVVDAGPLGFRSIAAHGHADALSFTLSVGGIELLIDPGTFAYHTQRSWRDYFRGTSAHNTVRIDAQDQSRSGGNFLWHSHARTRVIGFSHTSDGDRLVAEHDGYQRLADPVLHRRDVRLDHASSTVTVLDEISCKGEHDVQLFWHFAEDCDVRRDGDRVVARCGPAELSVILPAGMQYENFHGSDDPMLGWVSRRFDERHPCWTIRAARRIRGTTRFMTTMTASYERR
jgi:Heparinase II/III-like protein/Heparinase II/III N-terminus